MQIGSNKIMGIYSSNTYLSDLAEAASESMFIRELAGKRVLIAGAGGLIGSTLVDFIGAASVEMSLGIEVIAAGRTFDRLQARFSDYPFSGLALAKMDVSSDIELDCAVDYVIHAASNAHPASITADPVGTIEANLSGTLGLLNWGMKHGMRRLLYVSSGEVYGQGDPRLAAFPESYQGYVDPLNMRSCYPLSKRMSENACISFMRQHGSECVIVRPCHTYGPASTALDSRAASQFIATAAANNDVVLNSAGKQERSWCYAVDAASAIAAVLVAGKSGHAYNIALPDCAASISKFAETVAHAGGVDLQYRFDPSASRKDESPIERQVLNAEALLALGWEGKFPLKRGITHSVMAAREARGC